MSIDRTTSEDLDAGRVEELVAQARREVETGRLPSCQLALAREGRPVLSVALGEAGPGDRYVIFSVTKALTAGAVWTLLQEGLLSISTPVADLIPGFGSNGKGAVTVEHLLLHTSGFPRAPMHPLEGATSEGRVARFARWRLDWPPGTRYEYHPTAAHWVLAELIERVTGADFRREVHRRVIDPLGLPTLRLGVPAEEQGNVLPVKRVGEALSEAELRDLGIADPGLMLAEVGTEQLLRFNDPDVLAVGVPGAGAVGTAQDVALYFQALLHNPAGLWDPAILAQGTSRIRNRLPDPFTRVPANRSLGLVVAGDDGLAAFRGFAHDAGARTFGSPGVGGQMGWADPDTGLSFGYLTNGLDADIVRAARRSITLQSLAAACAR
jgi:CubicO group peptidase (beta-lactamase class C family)